MSARAIGVAGIAFFASVGRLVMALFAGVGRVARFGFETVVRGLTPPYYPGRLLEQMLHLGWFSLPVVGLTAIFTGAALAQQIYTAGSRFSAQSTVPAVVVIGMVRELGPVLVGLMVAGRVSSSMAAELGTMRVTEQMDAMTTLRTDPYRYLLAPRLFAAVITMPLLVLVANAIGIMGGYLLAVHKLGFNAANYLSMTRKFISADDFQMALAKAAVFGFFIALMGCYHGFRTEGGAAGVGRATTDAVVSAFILILSSNLIITVMAFG
ncbi:MlaE family ABC transporter permease [Sphingomonas prati]|uniref:Phospholipid/cholesterol/gamma-HCH transport system permease protein n=1 Tax=Sphingomonas prati TaxID=1843237 RepID=A0A7W9F3Z7_9SPHN|nr:ABC transporter permease [Sphingomonas prati]MBB5730070.1 phospholipid/cholesterol/gamma-HCH transport system permease protein [Sphingomonas prati]GGE91211.1 ABC transporter permease [Sphingomonas prati]